MPHRSLAAVFALAMAPVLSIGQPNSHFQTLEVQTFTVGKGVVLPAGYMDSMMRDIVQDLAKSKRFETVSLQTENAAGAATHTEQTAAAAVSKLTLLGRVTEFAPGNRAARVFGGGWAGWAATQGGRKGQAKATVHVKFIEAQSGRTLLEKDLEAVLRAQPMTMNINKAFTGGSASETAKGLAKQIAKLAKSTF